MNTYRIFSLLMHVTLCDKKQQFDSQSDYQYMSQHMYLTGSISDRELFEQSGLKGGLLKLLESVPQRQATHGRQRI